MGEEGFKSTRKRSVSSGVGFNGRDSHLECSAQYLLSGCKSPNKHLQSDKKSNAMKSEYVKPDGQLGGERSDGLVEMREVDRSLDRIRRGQLHKLSQFNEALSAKDSASIKFQWKHLLTELNQLKAAEDEYTGGSSMVKEFQESGDLNHGGLSGLSIDKSVVVESNRSRSLSRYPSSVGIIKDYGHTTHGSLLLTKYANFWDGENERVCFHKYSHLDKILVKQSYQDERNLTFYGRDGSSRMTPHSQLNDMRTLLHCIAMDYEIEQGPYQNGHHAEGYGERDGLLTEPFGYDNCGQKLLLRSGGNIESHLRDTIDFPQPNYTPTKPRDYLYQPNDYTTAEPHAYICEQIGYTPQELHDYTLPEFKRREGAYLETFSKNLYDQMGNVEDSCNQQDPLSIAQNPTIRKLESTNDSHRLHPGDVSLAIKYTEEALGSRRTREYETDTVGTCNEYGIEPIGKFENVPLEEEYGYGTRGNTNYYEDCHGVLEHYPDLYVTDNSSPKELTSWNLDLHSLPVKLLKRKCSFDNSVRGSKCGAKFPCRAHPSQSDCDFTYTAEAGEQLSCSTTSDISSLGRKLQTAEKPGLSRFDQTLTSSKLSIFLQCRLGKPHYSWQ
ncbi:hypothetical protein Ancab_011221 [Ancistrocladus abbreviatus]